MLTPSTRTDGQGWGRPGRDSCAGLVLGVALALLLAASANEAASRPVTATPAYDPNDTGIYVHYCPGHRRESPRSRGRRVRGSPRGSSALASHEGWPPKQCLKMDKGPVGEEHTLDGLKGVHNWLLGGYGNDTIYAGDEGDVIWGDYQPSGQSEGEHDRLHGGAGNDWIYSSHGSSEIWTGAGNDHLALIYGHGVVYCNGTGLKILVMRYLPKNRHWHLIGCSHKRIDPYKA